ncbi:MAG: cell division protein ZapA [Dinoroseobacter sp.]|nr:cell division protein ZapA [Dinoroseobacter sp.]MDJ0994217.1 cell division protein ZapA [Dinoroseobacter sp.]
MPEVSIHIGGRDFVVACQAGEEQYLKSAAAMLNAEASVLADQAGRMTEARLLLMSGLMLADKTAGMEDRLRDLEARLAEVNAELETARSAPGLEPERIEVPMVPPSVTEALTDLVAQAESLADALETGANT